MFPRCFPVSAFTLALIVAACGRIRKPLPAPGDSPATSPTAQAFPAVPDQSLLHNGHIVTPKVISGAQPEGEKSFKALADLGVKTIISVDGAKPDAQTARKYGIRYVHLPITYSTVTEQQGKAIAKAIADLPGSVYVHCHHGKHRSAAAVAVACVYNGQLPPERAEDVLRTFGTGHNYTGLWKAARDARPLDRATLDALKTDYVEAAPVPALAEAMVHVDDRWEHIKLIQKAAWAQPPDHPDLDPPHETLQLQEVFRELARADDTATRPEPFKRMLAESVQGLAALRELLAVRPVNHPAADAAFKRIAASCNACHKTYRD